MGIVERAVSEIVASQGSDLRELTRDAVDAGIQPPSIILSPTDDEMVVPQHRSLRRWWQELERPHGLPHSSAINPLELRDFMGLLAVVEPINGGADFRYRLYGSTTAAFTGKDLTGKTTSKSFTSGVWPAAVSRYHLVAFQVAQRSRQAVLTMQAWHVDLTPYRWHRLILPFDDTDGVVNRLILLTVPCKLDNTPLPQWESRRR